jgi:hypothetical protein
VTVSLRRSRLLCPCCDYWTSAVYDTRPGLTRDFEELVAYFATKTDKTAITQILRIDWDTVGRACERVVADGLDPAGSMACSTSHGPTSPSRRSNES